jgi:hypothetical protein
VIADVVGYFEDHNHADAYKPGGTVLGTTIVNTTTTRPATTTTVAVPVYDVPDSPSHDAVTNGNNLRAFLVGKSNRTVTIAPVGYNIGDQPLVVPPGVTLQGVTQYTTDIIGNSPLASLLPIVILSENATLTGVGVSGKSGGAGVQFRTSLNATASITNVIINVSRDLFANGAVFNSGSGTLRMTNVRTISRYGVNNGDPGNVLQSGSIVISGSDVDGVVQNAPGGSISVSDSLIGRDVVLPESGATSYKTGYITLTRVTVYSPSVGIFAVDPPSRIDVLDSQIRSNAPRQADHTGTTLCSGVTNVAGGSLSPTCT